MKEQLPIYGFKTLEIENNSGRSSELGISTSLALKCRNLSLGDPNWMIPIGEEKLEPNIQMSEEPLPIYGVKIPEIKKNSG